MNYFIVALLFTPPSNFTPIIPSMRKLGFSEKALL